MEAYMTTSAYGFKTVGAGEHGGRVSRFACLEKLSAVLKMLGSKTVPVWFDKDEERREPFVQSFDDVWREVMKKILEDGDESFSESDMTPFWQVYYTLGT
jgi:hypothetical protein